MDWGELAGPVISAVGQVGGGLAAGSGGGSSDGFSQKGFGQYIRMMPGEISTRLKSIKKYSEKYGFHPLAVLGQTAFNAAPTITGDQGYPNDYGIAGAMADMGQGLSRAMATKDTEYERKLRDLDLAYKTQQLHNLQLEGQSLEKGLRDVPTLPAKIDDLGNVAPPGAVVRPKQITPEGNPGTEVGHNPASQWFTVGDGNDRYFIRGMSERFADASEEDPLAKGQYWKAQGTETIKGIAKPPYPPPKHIAIPRGKMWRWFASKGWKLVPATDMLRRSHSRSTEIYWAPTFE